MINVMLNAGLNRARIGDVVHLLYLGLLNCSEPFWRGSKFSGVTSALLGSQCWAITSRPLCIRCRSTGGVLLPPLTRLGSLLFKIAGIESFTVRTRPFAVGVMPSKISRRAAGLALRCKVVSVAAPRLDR